LIKILFLILSVFLFSSCGLNEDRKSITRAFFGDKENDRVVMVDVEEMKLNPYVYTGHASTYTADEIYGLNKTYVVNRGENFIDVLDIYSMKITKSIELEHFPRSSEAINMTLGLAEASGMDKAMASIINIHTDEVVSVVGSNEKTNIDKTTGEIHGGNHATGHPFWFDKNHFALLDRKNSRVVTYHIAKLNDGSWSSTILNTLDTTTSIHQIIPNKKGFYQGEADTFYLTAEGNNSEFPSIIEAKFSPEAGLIKTDEISLTGGTKADMYIHHGDFHPTKPLIYVGANVAQSKGLGSGKLFVINYENNPITIDKVVDVGKGAGHACMIPPVNRSIVINHADNFVSVINTITHENIANITVSTAIKPNQAHMNYHHSDDGRYFYAFVTSDGIMYELDLENLEVSRTVDVGGQPAQGSFITVLVD